MAQPHRRVVEQGGQLGLERGAEEVEGRRLGGAAPDAVADLSRRFAAADQRALPIGRVVAGPKGVVYDLGLTSFEE